MKTILVIPTYNERDNIPELVDRLDRVREQATFDVLFIDDNSPDGTHELIRSYMENYNWISLIVRKNERGLGTALKRGYTEALNRGYDVLIQMDSDLQHPPEIIPNLIEKVDKGFNAVIASRYVQGGGIKGWSFSRRLVSKVANLYAKFMLGLSVSDLTTGYRAYDREALKVLANHNFISKGYSLQVEALYLVKKAGLKICEVPFTFVKRERGKSKMGIREIISFLINIYKVKKV